MSQRTNPNFNSASLDLYINKVYLYDFIHKSRPGNVYTKSQGQTPNTDTQHTDSVGRGAHGAVAAEIEALGIGYLNQRLGNATEWRQHVPG